MSTSTLRSTVTRPQEISLGTPGEQTSAKRQMMLKN